MNAELKAAPVVETTTEAAKELAASVKPDQTTLDGVNAKLSKATSWTPEENACIDGLQSKLGITRREAIMRLRAGQKKGHSAERVLAEAVAPIRQPKELNKRLREMGDKAPHVAKSKSKAAEPKGESKAKGKGKYDQELIIRLWERDEMRPSEIKEASDKYAGLKGISSVYISRVLFGTTYDNGQTAEQKARHKVEQARRKARQGDGE